MKEACGNCRYGLESNQYDEALCRRHAPVVLPIISTNRYEEVKSAWPKMSRRDGWCGDYEKQHDGESK